MLLTTRYARRLAIALASAVLLTCLSNCGYRDPKQACERVLTRHFQIVRTNGFDAAMADYGEPFFQKTRKEDWSHELTKLSGKLGKYHSHAFLCWRIFKTGGPFGPGTTVNVQCRVTYSKHSAIESFTLFKPALDSEYKIAGHQFALDTFFEDGS